MEASMFRESDAGMSRDVDLEVRGRIPAAVRGSLLVAASRRHKDRARFGRWHDSPADLIRIIS
jgi:hypothetical protein